VEVVQARTTRKTFISIGALESMESVKSAPVATNSAIPPATVLPIS